MEIIGTLFQIYLIATGGAFLAAALWLLRRWLRLLRVGVRTPGEVIGWVKIVDTVENKEAYQARVRFAVDGKPREFISTFGSGRQGAVGKRVTVLFDPRAPDTAEVASPLWMTAGPLVLAALGLAGMAAALT